MDKARITKEVRSLNFLLKKQGVEAGIKAKGVSVFESSHMEYLLTMSAAQRISKIASLIPEMENVVAQVRGKNVPVLYKNGAIHVPVMGKKRIMSWDRRVLRSLEAGSMLLGKSFSRSGARVLSLSFDDAPHVLVVGTTGAGKSVLMQSMIASLCAQESADSLRLVIVDLKNKDMLPFANWPHVITLAKEKEAARTAILAVQQEKQRRVDSEDPNPYRLILVIDELAQLANEKEIVDILGDIASIGRSLDIYLLVATQHPTEKGGMGGMMKANFPARLVGKVAAGMSSVATGFPEMAADKLPGDGSFLCIQGDEAIRFQSYLILPQDIEEIGLTLKPASKDITLEFSEEAVAAVAKLDPMDVMVERVRPYMGLGLNKTEMYQRVFDTSAAPGGRNLQQMNAAIAILEEEPEPEPEILKLSEHRRA